MYRDKTIRKETFIMDEKKIGKPLSEEEAELVSGGLSGSVNTSFKIGGNEALQDPQKDLFKSVSYGIHVWH